MVHSSFSSARRERSNAMGLKDKSSKATEHVSNVMGNVEAKVTETAEKASQGIKSIVAKAVHVVQETTQRVAHTVKETASKVEQRRQELAGTAAERLEGRYGFVGRSACC